MKKSPCIIILVDSSDFVGINEKGTGKEKVLDFSGGITEVMVPIDIINDTNNEANGTITITLIADTADSISYTVAPSPNNSAVVNVVDDDSLPIITIAADSGEVTEGNSAEFKLSATGLTATTTLMINATPSEDGHDYLTDAIAGTPTTYAVQFTDTDRDYIYTGEFSATLNNDTTGEATGSIKLTLNDDPSEIVKYKLGSETEGKITVFDDDAPVMKVSAGTAQTENDNVSVSFTFAAKSSPNKPIIVRYNLAESEDYIDDEGSNIGTAIDFSNNATEATLTIPIINDNELEGEGTITLTLIDDTAPNIAYTVAAAPDHTAEVNVYDDDSPPTVRIAADSGDATEGDDPVKFKLSATGLLTTATLDINATPAENGSDFLTDSVADTAADFEVEFTDSDGDNTYTGELSVELDNDDNGEATGTIKVTLNPDQAPAEYQLGSDTEGLLTILDDDVPELKISADSTQLIEGDNVTADFTISTEVATSSNITVQYNLTESGDYIDNEGSNKTAIINLNNQAKEATLSIPIINDEISETAGTITVTLLAENTITSYTVAASPDDSATINVYDDDVIPIVSIVADNGNVAENIGQADFSLTATGLTSDTTLMINATPSDPGSGGLFLPTNLENVATDYSVQFSDTDSDSIYNGTLVVDIHDDDIREFTGEIALTLNNDTQSPKTYVLGSTTRGKISVYDDDLPLLSIASITSSITEADNTTADFEVSSISSVNRYIPVRYQISSNSFVDDDGTIKEVYLDFSNGATSATLSIPVVNDENSEADDEIVLTLRSSNIIPPSYVLASAPDNTARVSVYDDDSPPTISIASDSGDVFENVTWWNEAKFDIVRHWLDASKRL